MGITAGMLIVGISIIGVIGCIAAMIASRTFFSKQRKKLLEKIETE